MAPGAPPTLPDLSLEQRVLEAARVCCERWGRSKVTVDDIAGAAGTSRATVYRLFPGGRDALFEAMRARETADFFAELQGHLEACQTLEDVVVVGLVAATRLLRDDEHLQLMLASTPGDVAQDLTVEGLPNIIATAQASLHPFLAPHLDDAQAGELAEWLSRLVISYFLAPSTRVDLGDPVAAATFARRFVLPAFSLRR
jgi:AcrR family transcriptional regulator